MRLFSTPEEREYIQRLRLDPDPQDEPASEPKPERSAMKRIAKVSYRSFEDATQLLAEGVPLHDQD